MAEVPVQNVPARELAERPSVPSRRDPFGPFRDVDTAFDHMVRNVLRDHGAGGPWPGAFVPAVDIEETDDAFIVEVELPGVRRDDITIEAGPGELHITGEVVDRERTGVMRHRTRRTGRFSYRVSLPAGTDPTAITATYQDGVLTITVPRSESGRPHRVDIG
jgi:HSP20 family protein